LFTRDEDGEAAMGGDGSDGGGEWRRRNGGRKVHCTFLKREIPPEVSGTVFSGEPIRPPLFAQINGGA
jgi:hypothetical protein